MDNTMIFIILFGGMAVVLLLIAFICACLIEMFNMTGLKGITKYSWITAFIFAVLSAISYILR